jgi:hypothetical protein
MSVEACAKRMVAKVSAFGTNAFTSFARNAD